MINMTNQNYYMVNESTNICDNVVVWDGDTNTWTPPQDYLMLAQDTTQCKNWGWNDAISDWELVVRGEGSIGFTWDGTYLITNEPKPDPIVQPIVDGAQTL